MTSIGSSAAATSASVRAGITGAGRRDIWGYVFQVLLLGSLLFSLAILFVLIADVLSRAVPVFAERGLGFLTSPLSSNPAKAGIVQGLVGTAILAAIVAVLAFPFGLATAIYLEEYAADTRLTRFIQINIRNLAGVPSVVYGLLGLSVFVAFMNTVDGDGSGRNILAGGITLAVLVLPIVIITSIEALRSVPNTIREAGYGVGASRWEVTRQLVLPSAAPGHPDRHGARALARAGRDRAAHPGRGRPRIVLAGYPSRRCSPAATPPCRSSCTTGPASRRRPFRADAAAAIVVLLIITLVANVIAILLRSRYERAW